MAEIINYNRTIEVVSQNDTYIFQKEDLIIVVNATKIIFQQAKFNLELNYAEITSPATANITALKDLINGYLGSVETPAMSRVTNASNITAGKFSVSVTNTGVANGTLLGVTLKPNETVEFSAQNGNNLSAIAYVATGTEFLIITTTV